MSGLTLMMKNASLGTDENIDFTLPAANWTDNNFSGSTSTGGPSTTTLYYYTYADSYTFNPKTGRYSLNNPSVGLYSDISGTLQIRLGGILIIVSSLLYWYSLKFQILRHQKFSLVILGLGIIAIKRYVL